MNTIVFTKRGGGFRCPVYQEGNLFPRDVSKREDQPPYLGGVGLSGWES